MSTLHFSSDIGLGPGPLADPWKNCEVDIFFCRVLKNWPIYTVIGRPGGHRSCFVAMAPRCQAPSFVIDGVRCQPRRSKKATWDDLIEVGNAGWRGSDAVAPSFLVRVRVGQSQRDAVEQHKNLRRQLIEPELRPVLARQDAS